MYYPKNLIKGDIIGICAPSGGITDLEDIKKLEEAEKNLTNMGYKIIETQSVRKEEKGRSATGKKRAEEFMELLENEDVKLIIFASGGDFLVEILDYLDFEKIKKLPPKWLQGYSDITGINFLFNTILDIPTMYCQTIRDYAMKPLFRNLSDALKIEQGEEIEQKSFEKHKKVIDYRVEEISNYETNTYIYELTENVQWKNITGEEKIHIKGRTLGGCLDCVKTYIGTKYDKVKEYIKRHKDDGIIWFLEVFEMSTPELYRTLWQMENAGYFENCTGIIFGRPSFMRNDYDTDFNETVKQKLGNLNIPIICDADIGHVKPQMAIVNGAILEITSENGKGTVKTFLE